MKKAKLSQSILSKIEKEHITPTPKWVFWIKNCVFWFIFVVAVLIGARAIGVVIKVLNAPDFAMFMESNGGIVKPLWAVLPLFWISFFSLFVIFAILGLHQTRHGYRLSIMKLVGINIFLSRIVGAGSYAAGDAHRFEEQTKRLAPFIKTAEERREQIWSEPEEGRLAGIVVEVSNGQVILLNDLMHQQWQVTLTEAKIWDQLVIQPQIKVRISGQKIDENQFEAFIISPWKAPSHPFKKRLIEKAYEKKQERQ